MEILFKDDVTFILLLDVSFVVEAYANAAGSYQNYQNYTVGNQLTMLHEVGSHGDQVPSRNQVRTERGIESPSAHGTSILEAGRRFSSITCALSTVSVPLRNYHPGGIDSSLVIDA